MGYCAGSSIPILFNKNGIEDLTYKNPNRRKVNGINNINNINKLSKTLINQGFTLFTETTNKNKR